MTAECNAAAASGWDDLQDLVQLDFPRYMLLLLLLRQYNRLDDRPASLLIVMSERTSKLTQKPG